jgi:DNA-binding MarR family transcriptional regulator
MFDSKLSRDARDLARDIVAAGRGTDASSLDALELRAATIAAGVDPEVVDPSSDDYRLAVAETLAAVLGALRRQLLSLDAVEVLRRSNRARLLNLIGIRPGLTQRQLADAAGIQTSNLSVYLKDLRNAGFIEPTRPNVGIGKAWALTNWGRQTHVALITRSIDVRDIPSDERESGARHLAGLTVSGTPAGGRVEREEIGMSREEIGMRYSSSEWDERFASSRGLLDAWPQGQPTSQNPLELAQSAKR